MATSSFVMGSGTGISAVTSRNSRTTFMCFCGTQVVESSSVSSVGNNTARGKNWLPPVRMPIGYATITAADGTQQRVEVQIDDQYYRFLDEVAQRRLGGVNGQTIADVGSNATAAIAAVSTNAQAIASIGQQSDAAAAAATAVKEVLVATAVPGAAQIPSVPRRVIAY